MRRVIYSIGVSLDGYIADPDGEIDWTAPDEELHRFHNEQTRELGAHFCGRRLYETMVYWETADQNPSASEYELEFARIWQALPKIVFSTTLDRGRGQAPAGHGRRSPRRSPSSSRSRARTWASAAPAWPPASSQLGLIDEYRLFVSPVVLGGGTPYFPPLDQRIALELVETRTFGSKVVYLRYRRA